MNRTTLKALAWFATLWLATAAFTARADAPDSQPVVTAVESIGITVTDLDRAVAFYTDVLGFERIQESEVGGDDYEHLYGVFGLRMKSVEMRLGDERIELMQFLAPRGRPAPTDSKSNDRWFQHIAIIVTDMQRAYEHLRAHAVEHDSSGPQRLPDWNPNAGGISAFYFRDPDGNPLEVLHFPPNKGAAKWHRQTDRLFLGIDHTALVVADTDASLKFYGDLLGMKVVGTSENYGPEQERLNNVFGTRLRITTLHALVGPGVELLEYLSPRTGRAMPSDTQANDGWHWQVNATANVTAADRIVRHGHYDYVSPGPQQIDHQPALMVRDPDGHALLFRGAHQ